MEGLTAGLAGYSKAFKDASVPPMVIPPAAQSVVFLIRTRFRMSLKFYSKGVILINRAESVSLAPGPGGAEAPSKHCLLKVHRPYRKCEFL
jgi:hypothetical protein